MFVLKSSNLIKSFDVLFFPPTFFLFLLFMVPQCATNPQLMDMLHIHTHIRTRSEVTEGALQVWRTLPERIRQDPSLASFRQEHERLHGGKYSLLDKDP